jgi:hypothetical protein
MLAASARNYRALLLSNIHDVIGCYGSYGKVGNLPIEFWDQLE